MSEFLDRLTRAPHSPGGGSRERLFLNQSCSAHSCCVTDPSSSSPSLSLFLFLQTALSSFFQEANIPSHHQMVSVFISQRRKKSSAAVFSILSLSSGNIASERIMRGWTSWRPQMLLKSLKYTYVSQGFLETVRLVFHAQFPASLWLRWNLTSCQGNFWMSWFRSFSKWSTRKEVWSCLYLHWIDLSFFYE